MTDQSKFAADLATLMKAGMHKDDRRMAEASSAYHRLGSESSTRSATAEFLHELGLAAFQNPARSKVYIVPNNKDSMFAMRTEEVKAAVKGEAKSSMLAFAMLLVMGTFYPTRATLNQGEMNAITVEDVFATATKTVEIANRDKLANGPSPSTTMAEEWQKYPARDTSSRKVAFQEFFIKAALDALDDQKMVRFIKKENRWYPTERLAATVVNRFDREMLIATEAMSGIHDLNETE